MNDSPNPGSVPSLSSRYVVTEQNIRNFQHDGHLLLPHVVSEYEVNYYRGIMQQLVANSHLSEPPINERDHLGKAFLQTVNMWKRSKEIRRFVHAVRFARIAAQLLGCSGVRLYLDQAFFKEPHAPATPWHQDNRYWNASDPNRIVTMWMPLHNMAEGMGPLRFITGSHRFGECSFKRMIRSGLPETCYPDMQAGDATFHAGWTWHSAPENRSSTTREAITITYIAHDSIGSDDDNYPILYSDPQK